MRSSSLSSAAAVLAASLIGLDRTTPAMAVGAAAHRHLAALIALGKRRARQPLTSARRVQLDRRKANVRRMQRARK